MTTTELAGSRHVVLIRHAERIAGGNDPALSPAGRARARLLVRMLSDAPVKGVYVTQFARSQQTGQPTALAVGVPLTTYSDPTALAAAVTAAHANDTVLVVGHTNTVDEIAAAFGAPGVGELNETTFDRMFIIGRNLAGTTLIRVRYGAASL